MFNVVAPVTPSVPPTVAASERVVTPLTPNVPPTTDTLFDSVVSPDTANVDARTVAPLLFIPPAAVTLRDPATVVFPFAPETVNLPELTFISPVTSVSYTHLTLPTILRV